MKIYETLVLFSFIIIQMPTTHTHSLHACVQPSTLFKCGGDSAQQSGGVRCCCISILPILFTSFESVDYLVSGVHHA